MKKQEQFERPRSVDHVRRGRLALDGGRLLYDATPIVSAHERIRAHHRALTIYVQPPAVHVEV